MALFWAFTIGLLLAAYIVRLSIRSQFLISLMDHLKGQIAAADAIPEGQPIRTRAWLRFLLMHNHTKIFVMLCVIVAAPLALIWVLWPRRPDWALWQPLLASNLVVGLFCVLFIAVVINLQVESLKVAILCVLVLLHTVLLGIPLSFLWSWGWPRYIPLAATGILFGLLFICGVLIFNKIYWSSGGEYRSLVLFSIFPFCVLYHMMLPVLVILVGEIPAVELWGRGLKIGVTVASVIGYWISLIGLCHISTRGTHWHWDVVSRAKRLLEVLCSVMR